MHTHEITSKSIFITGTDTGVGKTFVSAALLKGLHAETKNLRLAYWKPVQTGHTHFDEIGSDAHFIKMHVGETVTIAPSLACFAEAASPDQAARKENKQAPSLLEISLAFEQFKKELPEIDLWVVEGAGGVFVPLNEEGETWLDFLRLSQLHTLVVARTSLGTLNQTFLSLDALISRDIDVRGVVFSGKRHDENIKSYLKRWPQIPKHHLPVVDLERSQESAQSLGDLASFFRGLNAAKDRMHSSSATHHIWYPYTQHQAAPAPLKIERARDCWLYDGAGKKYFDGISSWWVANTGHGREEVFSAMRRQQQKLDHVQFAGISHQPAEDLAALICAWSQKLDPYLDRVFFSDNGSTAIEVALKICYQAWQQRGETNRRLVLGFKGGYHGDTFGAMATVAGGTLHTVFKPWFFESLQARIPTTTQSPWCDGSDQDRNNMERDLEEIFSKQGKNLAAVVVEPLLQGAGGMLMHHTTFLRKVRSLCDAYDVPLIFDEVFTGLGRLGHSFAAMRAQVTPDILCLAKGLTGSTLPLALTVVHRNLFGEFLHAEKRRALLHGHTFTANPISCAAALANLAVIDKENLFARALDIESKFQRWIQQTAKSLPIQNARALGAVLAFEVEDPASDYFDDAHVTKFSADLLRQGLLIRPLGNTYYLVPPLVATDLEIDFCLDAFHKTFANA